jgi:hypothetical protein
LVSHYPLTLALLWLIRSFSLTVPSFKSGESVLPGIGIFRGDSPEHALFGKGFGI